MAEIKNYYLDLAGLEQYDVLIKQYINGKDLAIKGDLVEGDYKTIKALSDAIKALKLGDKNIIESVSVNGYDATIKDKKASVTIPEATKNASGVMSAADKSKLDDIEAGAEANVQADWNETNTGSDAYIKNKPTDLVKDSRTIAGVDLKDDITKAELLTALNVADGAEVNVQADWAVTDTASDAYIKNKPTDLVKDSLTIAGVDLKDNITKAELLTALNVADGAEVNYIKSVGDNLTVDTAGKLTVSIPAAAVTGVKKDDKVLALDGTLLTSAISLSYDSGKKEIYLKGKDDAVISTVSAADFIKDGMISDVEWSTESGKETTLVITFNTDAGKNAVEVDFQKLVDTYTAGNGIDVNGQVVSVKIANASKDAVTLSANTNGLSATLTGWDDVKAAVAALDEAYTPIGHTHSIDDIIDFAPIGSDRIAGLFSAQ
jgi:hypothetical protein